MMLLVLLVLAASTLFIVDQRQVAVVFALGEIKEVITEPGLKFKLPPPFQNVVFLDKRIQTLDNSENRPIFTAEKKSLVIDWLVKWRIVEPRQFIRNNGTDIRNLETRLAPVVHAAGQVTELCRFSDKRLTEISGITVSLLHPGVVWVHNDSSGGPYVYAIDTATCRTLARVRMEGIEVPLSSRAMVDCDVPILVANSPWESPLLTRVSMSWRASSNSA